VHGVALEAEDVVGIAVDRGSERRRCGVASGCGTGVSFKDYPPSQRPSSFSIDQLVEKMQRSFEAASGAN